MNDVKKGRGRPKKVNYELKAQLLETLTDNQDRLLEQQRMDMQDLNDRNKSLEQECEVLADKIDQYRDIIVMLLNATEVKNV